jgi:hypothetical protein
MKIILPKSKILTILLFFAVSYTSLNAQCSITGVKTTSFYTTSPASPCTTFSGCSTVYIGDGTTLTTLTINSNFDLSCLGSISLVVMNNASIVFGNGANDKLTLGEGSSILVNSGGNISGGNQCNSSDRIVIGTDLVSTCNGNAGSDSSFSDLVNFGGTGKATSNSPVCVGNNIVLSATPPPNGVYTYSWTGPNSFTSTLRNPLPFVATANAAGVYTVVIRRTSDNKTVDAYTTVVINPTPVGGNLDYATTPVCINSSVALHLSNSIGSIVRWEKRLNNSSLWTNVNNTTVNYTDTPSQSGTWEYRVLVGSGSCTPVYSSSISVVVNPELFITVGANPQVTQLSTTTTLSYIANNGSEFDVLYTDPMAIAAGFTNLHGNVSGNSGNITLNIPYCLSAGVYNATIRVIKNLNATNICSSQYYPFTITVNSSTNGGTLSSNQVICSGNSPSNLVLTGNSGAVVKWQKSSNAAFTSPTDISSTATALSGTTIGPLTQNTYFRVITNYAGCNKMSSNSILITVGPISAPTVGAITNPTCASVKGSFTITNYNASYTYNIAPNSGVTQSGSTINAPGGSYTITASTLSCGTSTATNFSINAQPVVPSITAISTPATLCSGGSLSLTAPTVTADGSAINSQGWQISTTSGGGTYTTLALPYTVAFADHGKNIRYMATNGCGTTNSNVVVLAVNDVPTITSISSPSALCSGSSFNPAAPTVTANGSAINSQGWQISTTSGGGIYTTLALPYTVAFADHGKNIRYMATNGCGVTTSNIVALTVKTDSGVISLNGTPIPSGNTTFSELTTATFSIDPIAGATGYVWSVPIGWKTEGGVAITSPVITAAPELKLITGSSIDNGNVTVTADNLFCPSSLIVTLTSIAPQTPAPNAVISVNCNTLGSVSFNNLPAGDWILDVKKDGNTINTITNVTAGNTTWTVGNLTAGDYTFTVANTYGTSASVFVTIDVVAKTWKGSGWFIGSTPTTDPTLNDIVIFEANYNPDPSSDSINACSCTVNSGVSVTIPSGKVLTVENGLNVQGTLMFKDGASLIQNNEGIVNTDNIIYERKTSVVKDFDYVYWSSPVAGQTLGALSPKSDKYWSWLGNYWTPETGNTAMTEGKGYIARVPRYVTSQTVNFIGPPNNGDVSIATQGILKSNLIGNPYPSAIDAELFMIDNEPLFLETGAMLYFWTHFAARDLNDAGTEYVYKTEDYAYFNLTGGTGAELGRPVPDGTIAAGQSFMVGSETGGFFTFNNSMRIGENDKNSHFFKQANTKKTSKIDKNRIWLNLANSGGAFKQLLVGYITGATNDADKLFDGVSLNGNAYVDFYSVMNSKKYTIQGRKLPFDEADEVPLGYKATIEGTFQISIDKTDGFLTNQTVYLEDKTANVIHDLKKGSYSFTTAKGDFKDRFVLRYTNTTKLGTGDFDPKGKGVIVSVNNSRVKINSFDKTISSVKVYDLKGSLLYEKNKVDVNEFIINQLASTTQFMIVMVQLEDGNWVSEEIIFHD